MWNARALNRTTVWNQALTKERKVNIQQKQGTRNQTESATFAVDKIGDKL
jgi:hypothetical protein